MIQAPVPPDERARRYGHAGAVIWLTGLSGAGKSTLAAGAERILFDKGYVVVVLDGDHLRRGVSSDLGFSEAHRRENVRRAGEIAALCANAGCLVLAAFISPFREDRLRARAASAGRFHEVCVHSDLATCERRDPRGLYVMARDGRIPDFTGIDSPYEVPDAPDLRIDTMDLSVEESIGRLVDYIRAAVPLAPRTMRAEAP